MLSKQQKWDRYCDAINYLVKNNYFVLVEDSNGGNVKRIRVTNFNRNKECIIRLLPRRYKKEELLYIVKNHIG